MKRVLRYFFFMALFLSLGNTLCLAADVCRSAAAEALREYATSLYKKGDFEDARHEFNKCLMIEPECSACMPKAAAVPKAGPVAVMEAQAMNECFTFIFDGTKSYDPDGKIVSYEWNFGDGARGSGPTVTHTYKKSGRYTVTLTVTDDSSLECNKATVTEELIVTGAPEITIEVPASTCPGTEVLFNAKAKSESASASNLKVTWDFGDGTTAEGTSVSHVYTKGGLYTVKVEVRDMVAFSGCDRSSAEATIKVNTPPVARAGEDVIVCFPADKQQLEVRFDGTSSYDADADTLSYLWDFGDGVTSNLVKPVHVYRKSGKYTVTLTVTDSSKSVCNTSKDTLQVVLNHPPVADAGPNRACCVNTAVVFDASGSYDPDGDELLYLWDLGDGTTKEGKQITYSYAKPGEYKVTLTVKDKFSTGAGCDTATAGFIAKVEQVPVAIMQIKPYRQSEK